MNLYFERTKNNIKAIAKEGRVLLLSDASERNKIQAGSGEMELK